MTELLDTMTITFQRSDGTFASKDLTLFEHVDVSPIKQIQTFCTEHSLTEDSCTLIFTSVSEALLEQEQEQEQQASAKATTLFSTTVSIHNDRYTRMKMPMFKL